MVMEIQRGESGRLPFFAIVPPGEESLGYAMLARHMGPEQPVYKIQGHTPVTGGKRPYSEQEMRDSNRMSTSPPCGRCNRRARIAWAASVTEPTSPSRSC